MGDPTADLVHPDLSVRLAGVRKLNVTVTVPYRNGTNLHIHTNHSFSVFRSPCEAAWLARQAGLEALGVNDFYTTGAYAEFGEACRTLGIQPVFGIEAIALDADLAAAGVLVNDPANAGRIYLSGKAVTHPEQASAQAALARLRSFQETRNRLLVAKADERFRATVGAAGPAWQDVLDLTPAGNITERHVAKAILERIRAVAVERSMPAGDAFKAVVGAPISGSDADQQNAVRNHLLKAGKPCYAPEDSAAFPSVASIRDLFLGLGAIPTYPVLGNPLTGAESDVRQWADRLDSWGFCALELIPHRNSEERVAAVVAEACRRNWPVFDGTEHNTPAMDPLTTRWGLDGRFRPAFRAGAMVALGHQRLVAEGGVGYLGNDGRPAHGAYQRCLAAGQRLLDGI
ncbi:MAG TPA: hypothetical protein DCS97_15010 [Planctomycetes bacterium]|nr:hypothetical protein [Planctomycetota bacterium]